MYSSSSLLVLLAFLGSVNPQCLSENDAVSPSSSDGNGLNSRDLLYLGERAFSFEMLRSAAKGSAENVFLSPYSAYNALVLAYFGSASTTERKLKKTLHLDGQEKVDLMKAYQLERYTQASRAINGSASYEFRSANRIFPSKKFPLRECMANLFMNQLEPLDYDSPEEARQRINSWVEEQTKGHIKNIIPGGQLDSSTTIVLSNAAYFKGLWRSKFNLESTRREVFYLANSQQTSVRMMHQKGQFNYVASEKLHARVLELPYKGDMSMFIFLPPIVGSGVDELLNRLNAETFAELLGGDMMFPYSVEIAIPRFTAESTIDLLPIFSELGAGELFTPEADLSGFTGSRNLHVNAAVQKARIEVDEQGTTAAAATALFSFRSSRPLETLKFYANVPFVYLLYDRSSNTITFAGVYRGPPQTGSEDTNQ